MANIDLVIAGIGSTLFRWNDTTNRYERIAQIMSITGPSSTRDTIDTTSLDTPGGYSTFIPNVRDGGDLSMDMNFTESTFDLMRGDFENQLLQDYCIVLRTGDSITSTTPNVGTPNVGSIGQLKYRLAIQMKGFVTTVPLEIPYSDKISMNCTIKVSGQLKITKLGIPVNNYDNNIVSAAVPSTAPGSLASVTATSPAAKQIQIVMEPPSNVGDAPVIGYKYQYKLSTASSYIVVTMPSPGVKRTVLIAGLAAAGTYNVQARAYNSAGDGPLTPGTAIDVTVT